MKPRSGVSDVGNAVTRRRATSSRLQIRPFLRIGRTERTPQAGVLFAVAPPERGPLAGRSYRRRPLPGRSYLVVSLLSLLGVLCSVASVQAQWAEPRGQGWTSIALYQQATDEVYSAAGDRISYPFAGRATASSAFVTTAVGLGHGFDAWVQASFQRLEFRDLTEVRKSAGLGDLRIFGRWSPTEWLGWSLPVALRAGIKIPVGDFDAFSSILPLGDGQTDVELVAEVGHSFWPTDAYLTAWLGYRWRRPQSATGFEIGDERFLFVSGARTWGRVGARMGLEGLFGREPAQAGVGTGSRARRLVRLMPSLTSDLGPGSIELGVRVPLTGRNLPAGPDLTVGYFMRWGGGS